GRRAPGASLSAAGQELTAISTRFDVEHPTHQRGHRPQVFSLRDYGDPQTRLVLWIMAAGVGMILLLACANVANVLLARATVRSGAFRGARAPDRARRIAVEDRHPAPGRGAPPRRRSVSGRPRAGRGGHPDAPSGDAREHRALRCWMGSHRARLAAPRLRRRGLAG